MSVGVQWIGLADLLGNIERHADNVVKTLHDIAAYFAPVLEGYAKQNAPWTDRTGNARQALAGYPGDEPPSDPSGEEAGQYPHEELAEEIVTLYLAHGMQYGIFLEKRWANRYAIIWPTIEFHLPQIERMLKETFS
jgi:hypothetical protein